MTDDIYRRDLPVLSEEVKQERRKERADKRPATIGDIAGNSHTLLDAIVSVLKVERRITNRDLKQVQAKLDDISGTEALRGGARIILAENAQAISKACEDPLHRKAVILTGEPPAFALELFQ